jgi:phosphoribosyl-AMP cyclohydrolase / phosphoribosyl-ATP pyrophosphohydrolase
MNIDFAKYTDGLAPAIVQDARDGKVLMLGFMNADALTATISTSLVTFYSRSRQKLWVKGETRGNFLTVTGVMSDCDNDTLLINATPAGAVCHKGFSTCFERNRGFGFLGELENIIEKRKTEESELSYVASLFAKGINKIAQKVGEEAVEIVIASKDDDHDAFRSEAADLLFHYLVLLNAKGSSLTEVAAELESRHSG